MSEKLNLSDTYVILDLDRTMLDTELANVLYQNVVREYDADLADQLIMAKDEAERDGMSFDLHQYIGRFVSPEERERFDERFVEIAQTAPLLAPGGEDLLEWLQEREVAHGVLTYGNYTWQKLKLRASGLDRLPHMVTPDSHKAHVLRAWQAASGEFHLPPEMVRHDLGARAIFKAIFLADDKPVSFEDLPPNVYGALCKIFGKQLKSQHGMVPEGITTVERMDHIISVLETQSVLEHQ